MIYVDLSRKLADLGYTVDRYTYECGERVTVRYNGLVVISHSADCGDDKSASERIEAWMDAAGWPHASTYASQ